MAVGVLTHKLDFLEPHATRMTTTWGDSAARGKHKNMYHPSPACTESAKNVEIVARPQSAHIRGHPVRHHRRAQRQNTAPSRPSRRRGRPQLPTRARPPLWGRPPLLGARLPRPCATSQACLAHPSEHSRARARHTPHATTKQPQRAAAARRGRAVRCARRPCACRCAHRGAQERAGGSSPSARRPCAVSSI